MGNWFWPYINFVSISSYFWRNNLLLLLQRERCDRCRRPNYSELKRWRWPGSAAGGEQPVTRVGLHGLHEGPHKNWKQTETKSSKEFSIKFSFRLSIMLANFSPWPAGLSGLSGMVAPSWPRLTRTTPVDGFQWRLIWFWKHRAEFKWNFARCAKTKTDIFV